jgi:hypothetical protein
MRDDVDYLTISTTNFVQSCSSSSSSFFKADGYMVWYINLIVRTVVFSSCPDMYRGTFIISIQSLILS